MKLTRLLSVPLALLLLNSCSKGLQGDVHNLSDAIEHCRDYSRNVLDSDLEISLDQYSTRQSREFYDVYMNVESRVRKGYAHCKIDTAGLIVLFDAPGFRRKGGAFSQF
ncbi:hypothetical protein ACQUQU_00510 [Thalassolituus sp. LLYu03]|uniref:hypothetical protein n=1 Tax=Thalassolituus sp. LLYu03 TaxID=3421656 RepID=UPI003D2A42A7